MQVPPQEVEITIPGYNLDLGYEILTVPATTDSGTVHSVGTTYSDLDITFTAPAGKKIIKAGFIPGQWIQAGVTIEPKIVYYINNLGNRKLYDYPLNGGSSWRFYSTIIFSSIPEDDNYGTLYAICVSV